MGGHTPLKKLVFSPFHQRGKGVGGTQHLVCWAGVRESGRCLKLMPVPPSPSPERGVFALRLEQRIEGPLWKGALERERLSATNGVYTRGPSSPALPSKGVRPPASPAV